MKFRLAHGQLAAEGKAVVLIPGVDVHVNMVATLPMSDAKDHRLPFSTSLIRPML